MDTEESTGSLRDTTEEDIYDAWYQIVLNKQKDKDEDPCPRCGSTNLISSEPRWICKECGKKYVKAKRK